MKNLINTNYDTDLHIYERDWIEKNSKNNMYKNPSVSLYTSMVYSFAKHLPYSMDIEQPEYVPADFFNMMPLDIETNNWFKWEDRRTFFNAMIRWSDTFKTGILLQICNIFQKMILGKFPADFELEEKEYTDLGIDMLTKNEEYNRNFFEMLKSLPTYYQKIINASDNNERRAILDEIYADLMNKIATYYGGFREVDTYGNIKRESNSIVPIHPSKDVEMLVFWENIEFHDGISSIIQFMKEEQLKSYSIQRKNRILIKTLENKKE